MHIPEGNDLHKLGVSENRVIRKTFKSKKMLTGSLGKMENEKLCKFVIFTQYYDTIKSRRKRCIRERNAGKISVIPTDWK